MDDILQGMAAGPKEGPHPFSPADLLRSLEAGLGLSIEKDIVPVLANEVGAFLSDIDLSGPFPVLKLTLFAKITDKAAVENIMDGLIKKGNLILNVEDHKGRPVKYVSLPLGTNFQPGYCFLEDYFLISLNRQSLEEAIDASENKSLSLLENEDFQSVDFGLREENNTVSFLDLDLLFTEIEEVCSWLATWFPLLSSGGDQARKVHMETLKERIAEKEEELEKLKADAGVGERKISSLQKELDKEKEKLEEMIQQPPKRIDAATVKFYLDEVVSPLLDGLKMYKATSSRSVIVDQAVEVTSYTRIEY